MRSRVILTVALAAAMLAVMLVFGGCTAQLNRIDAGVQTNSDAIAEMSAQNRRIQQEMTALAALFRLDQTLGEESSAERIARLSQLTVRIDQLMMMLEDNSAYMRDLSARVDLLATRAGIPTLGEYRPPTAGESEGLAALPEEGRSIFQAAQLDRNRGNVEMAREGFEEFLTRYGNSELADDALYWLGVLDYDAGEHEAALVRFDELRERYPLSMKAPAALYKSAAALQQLGNEDAAAIRLRDLVETYPDSEEAALAREQLEGS